MNRRLFSFVLATLAGAGLALTLLFLNSTTSVLADAGVHCVNQTGAGCDAVCGGGCYSLVQAAVDAASTGHEIRIAGGTYFGPGGGTVAAFASKELVIRGGYNSTCSGFDPDMYRTVLDAQWGGSVISVTSVGNSQLDSLTLTHGEGTGSCSGGGCGGGIYARETDLHVVNCIVQDNVGTTSGSGWGGGIYVGSSLGGHHVDIWSSRIVSNTANTLSTGSGNGGGIFVVGGSVSVVQSHILDNLAKQASGGTMPFGGGLYLSSLTQADVLTNVIRGNRASTSGGPTSWGGGLYVSGSSGVLVSGNRVEDNHSSGGGGGIYSDWNSAHMARNTIIDNVSSAGGGVYVRALTPVTLSNNLIARNSAPSLGDGVLVSHYDTPPSRLILINNTIADNGSTGVVGNDNVVLTLTNNLIAGHTLGFTTTVPASATVSADHNLFWNTSDPIAGTNPVLEDPLLVSSYGLGEGSPALDAGADVPWLTVDLEGHTRPKDGVWDIGAFEGARSEAFLPLVLRSFP